MNNKRRPGDGQAGSADVLTRAARHPDLVVRYGDGPDQVADVYLPAGATHRNWTGERAPLAIFLHGGFWRAEYGREHTGPLAEALADAGFVVCAPEYRRSGQPGGGWPGTFDDVATAADRLPRLVAKATHGLVDPDPAWTILAGHSAGGHLALWAAAGTGCRRARGGGPSASPGAGSWHWPRSATCGPATARDSAAGRPPR